MASNVDNCPHCNADLNGDPIPKEYAEHYSGTHWRREIGIEYMGKYDGVWEWKCPDCSGVWPSEINKIITEEKKARRK